MTAGTATGGEAVRKILYVTLTLLVALTATLTQPKAEAQHALALGVVGI